MFIDNSKWKYNKETNVFWQTGILYCSAPINIKYETLGIFVPAEYMKIIDNNNEFYTCEINYTSQLCGYTAESAPIVIPIETPGYKAMTAPVDYVDNSIVYTKAGFIYIMAGCRGREEGAPCGVTDLKAAIKFIRYNGKKIAGNKDRIFTFGMSGGGAQSALIGTTGNCKLYQPYLNAIGAFSEYSDAVMGSMCWCPITNLDYSNEAYEWNMGMTRKNLETTPELKLLSDKMAEKFAQYINNLKLKYDNNILYLNKNENGYYLSGSYYDCMKKIIEKSLNKFLSDTIFPYTHIPKKGRNRFSNPPDEEKTYENINDYISDMNKNIKWIIYDKNSNSAKITSVEDFVSVCKIANKKIGAFDSPDCSQVENILFGYNDSKGAHFDIIMAELLNNTDNSDFIKKDNIGNTVDVRMNMYNPMYYISDFYKGYNSSDVAPFWRIRSGITQNDTALATEINLSIALKNYGANVDFETIWDKGHIKAEFNDTSDNNFIKWVNNCLKK